MKKVFFTYAVGVILVAMLVTPKVAQADPASAAEKEQKQRVKIVVLEKKERPGGGSQPQRPQPENRGKKA